MCTKARVSKERRKTSICSLNDEEETIGEYKTSVMYDVFIGDQRPFVLVWCTCEFDHAFGQSCGMTGEAEPSHVVEDGFGYVE